MKRKGDLKVEPHPSNRDQANEAYLSLIVQTAFPFKDERA